MDPVSIVSLVDGAIGLALKCAGAVQTMNDLAGKYKYAKLTILSITQNLDTMQFAWDRIGAWSQAYVPYENADEDGFVLRMARFLETGTMVMDALEEELLPFSDNNATFAQRSKFVWNETTLQCHQSRIRDQAASMSLLLHAIQLPTPQDRRRLVQESRKQFQKSDESAYSIVPSLMSRSTSQRDGQESIRSEENMVYRSLSFENDLFSARVYKRNYRNPMLLQLLKSRTRKDSSKSSISMPRGATPNPWKRLFQGTKHDSAASESQDSLQVATVPRTHPQSSRFAQHSYTASIENSPLREEAFDAIRITRNLPSYSPIRARTDLEGADEDETIHSRSAHISNTHPPNPTSAVESLSQRPKNHGLSIQTNSILIERLGQQKAQEVITRLEGYRAQDKDIRSAATEKILLGTPIEVTPHLSPVSISWHEEAHGIISEALPKQGPNKSFIDACEQGDPNVVENFLRRGQDVHTQHAYPGLPHLKGTHVAVLYRHIDVLSKLLSYGASIEDDTTSLGLRPLHLVAQLGDVPMIKYLLERGAQVSARNNLGEQPVHLASESGSVEALRILIEGGATIDCIDQGGRQPLHRAAESSEQPDAITYLSRMGADINARVVGGLREPPLNMACRRDLPENVSALLTLGAKTDGDCAYEFFLGTAIEHGSLSALKALLEHDVNPNQRDSHGRSALHILVSVSYHWAEHHKHKQSIMEEMIQLLLIYHADIHAEDNKGDTALHYLAGGSSSPSLEGRWAQILSDNHADPNAINKDGLTSLCLAVLTHSELSGILISLGARLLIKRDEIFLRLYVEKPADSDTPQYELHLTGSKCGPKQKRARLQDLRMIHACFSRLGIACVMRDFGHGVTASTEVLPL